MLKILSPLKLSMRLDVSKIDEKRLSTLLNMGYRVS